MVLDPAKARLHIFTDDPVVVMRGTRKDIDTIKTKLILTWRALGFDLASSRGRADHEWRG